MARKTYEREVAAEQQKALALCRGSYQRGIILGKYRLSGADLQGKAKKYGAQYKKSRESLFSRLYDADIMCSVLYSHNRKKELVWGERMLHFAEVQRHLRRINLDLVKKLRRAIETGYRYQALRDQATLELEMHRMSQEKF